MNEKGGLLTAWFYLLNDQSRKASEVLQQVLYIFKKG